MEVFKNTSLKVGVVYTGFWRIKDNKKTYIPQSQVTQKEGNIPKELLKGNFVTNQGVVIRKRYFKKSGMFAVELLVVSTLYNGISESNKILRCEEYKRES